MAFIVKPLQIFKKKKKKKKKKTFTEMFLEWFSTRQMIFLPSAHFDWLPWQPKCKKKIK